MATRLAYYLLLKPLSWLPMRVLYFLSDFMFFWIYHVVGYRKKVVLTNLQLSFPQKSEHERKQIARKFYHHLCDVIVEGIKLYSISKKTVNQRMRCVNPELLDLYKNQSVVLVGGHYSNWEWYAAFANLHTQQQAIALYTPISNSFLNKKMKIARERQGIKMKSQKQLASVYRESLSRPIALIFATDQSPHHPTGAWWTQFLNQDTGVMMGTEHFARKGNHPVLYGELRKPKRGHYEVEYRVICEDPSKTVTGEITELHTIALEKTIYNRPELWLWSHRRWKHKRPENANQPR